MTSAHRILSAATAAIPTTTRSGPRLRAVAAEFGFVHRGLTNTGATWYGPTALVRRVAAATEMLTRYILDRHFRDQAGAWPGWYRGVSSLYGAEIAINHCAPQAAKTPLLDMVSTSRAPIADCVHIHCWHTDDDFSKHKFMAGGYRNIDERRLDDRIVADYALSMSLQSLRDLPRGASHAAPVDSAAAASPQPPGKSETDASQLVRQFVKVHLQAAPATAVAPLLASVAPAKLAQAAEYHGVSTLIAPLVASSSTAMTTAAADEARRMFKALASRHRHATAAREKCLDELLDAFAAAEVTVVVLKGAALGHMIYAEPAMRPTVDIDILVKSRDAGRAAAIAEANGFAFARDHHSRYRGRIHHLPGATKSAGGFEILLEIHDDAVAPDLPERITLDNLSAPPRRFERGAGRPALALGHVDMLRHLTLHAFEPTSEIRLKHLLDLWLYRQAFDAEIPWQELARRSPRTMVALDMAALVFRSDYDKLGLSAEFVAGIGQAMSALSLVAKLPIRQRLAALFEPPEWWLRGYYGIPLGSSVARCRIVDHPLTLAGWFGRRMVAGLGLSKPNFAAKG